MSIPKYKPTKWKLQYCVDCSTPIERDYWHKEHKILERDNVPFRIPDLKVDHLGYKGWLFLKSEKLKAGFSVSPSEVDPILKGCGIEPGGMITNEWWMWCKKGGSLSLKWLGGDSDGDA